MKGRKEMRMKAAAVIHMLSPRNLKIGSYTRHLNVERLVAVSRHPAIVYSGDAYVTPFGPAPVPLMYL